MSLNYGELSIDSKGRIVLPRFMNFRDKEELVLYLLNEYINILFPFEVKEYADKIMADESFGDILERENVKRVFCFSCMPVTVNYSGKNGSRINLTKQILSKYNFEKKLIYEIADNGRIRLWHPDKFLEYSNNLEKRTGRRK